MLGEGSRFGSTWQEIEEQLKRRSQDYKHASRTTSCSWLRLTFYYFTKKLRKIIRKWFSYGKSRDEKEGEKMNN